MGEQVRYREKDPEDRVGDYERWDEHRERLTDEELLRADRGDQDRLKRSLLAFTTTE